MKFRIFCLYYTKEYDRLYQNDADKLYRFIVKSYRYLLSLCLKPYCNFYKQHSRTFSGDPENTNNTNAQTITGIYGLYEYSDKYSYRPYHIYLHTHRTLDHYRIGALMILQTRGLKLR